MLCSPKSKTSKKNQPTFLLEDVIHLKSSRGEKEHGSEAGARKRRRFIIFFVTGNPGLIEYYRDFLTLLHQDLSKRHNELGYDFEVYGRSLSGFEVSNLEAKRNGRYEMRRSNKGESGLTGQINAVERDLHSLVNTRSSSPNCAASSSSSTTSSRTEKSDLDDDEPSVILIGHSAGAYVIMELIQRHRERLELQPVAIKPANPDSSRPPAAGREPRIVSGICLFPTVVDIARSSRGRMFTPLSKTPCFPYLIALAAKSLTTLLPPYLLTPFVARLTRFPPRATFLTIKFLSSGRAVRAAMRMARDEMTAIGPDAWTDEVWGAAHPSENGAPRPKLFFFFGRKDHWVAVETREEIIRCRGGDEAWRPRMDIDDDGLPHGFCVDHAQPVAVRCAGYVEEVVRLERGLGL